MSAEKTMRKRVVAILRPLHACSIENGVGAGTPDVNYARGWLELKSLADWPVGDETIFRVEHFTPQQRLWLRKRWLAGDVVHVLLKVADDWLLIDGWLAAVHLGNTTRSDLITVSERVWEGGLDEAELLAHLDSKSCRVRGRTPIA
jgi:hypothetical protein